MLATSDILALEPQLVRGWPPERVVELYGWRCGLDRGVTRRANSVWPLAWDGAAALDAAIGEAEAIYRSAGRRPCFRVMTGARPAELDAALAARGYASEGESHVLVASPRVAAHPLPGIAGLAPALLAAPSAAWLACYQEGRTDEGESLAVRGLFARIAAPHVFAAASSGGRIASVALAVATDGWVQVSAVRTLPEFRRRGLADLVLAAIFDWAPRQHARNLVLMVEASNRPALALYRKAGFRRVYDYHYRAKTPGDSPC
ncbi:MAG: GNAT family N-acetyltransferase [Alphaproteobacteria bacterium]